MPGKYKYDRETRRKNDIRLINERDLRVKLEQWRDLDNTNMCLVHSINPLYFKSTEFINYKAVDLFRKWDVISTSLITYTVKYGGINGSKKYTGMYGEVGFVLDVPPQNILGTHPTDVYFPNHIGTAQHRKNSDPWISSKDSWKLADSIFSGKGKHFFGIGKDTWPINKGKSYNIIQSPREILFASDRSQHNEILIIGRPGISMYHGYPPTQEIKVKAIIIGERDSGFTNIQQKCHLNEAVEKLAAMNPDLKIIAI